MALFFSVVILVAVLDWIAVAREWKRVEYFAKPAVMISLLLLLGSLIFTGPPARPLIFFALGIFFSLIGDVSLILASARDSNRWFLVGLVSFLLAHVSYIAGLIVPFPDVSPLLSIGIALLLAFASARILRRIITALQQKGVTGMIVPVSVYGLVITVMLLSAFLTFYNSQWSTVNATLVALGAMFFYFSDVILAWNKFVTPLKNGRVFNMVLYHLGQIALVGGIILQYGHS